MIYKFVNGLYNMSTMIFIGIHYDSVMNMTPVKERRNGPLFHITRNLDLLEMLIIQAG